MRIQFAMKTGKSFPSFLQTYDISRGKDVGKTTLFFFQTSNLLVVTKLLQELTISSVKVDKETSDLPDGWQEIWSV